jgi:hypothetical protein
MALSEGVPPQSLRVDVEIILVHRAVPCFPLNLPLCELCAFARYLLHRESMAARHPGYRTATARTISLRTCAASKIGSEQVLSVQMKAADFDNCGY